MALEGAAAEVPKDPCTSYTLDAFTAQTGLPSGSRAVRVLVLRQIHTKLLPEKKHEASELTMKSPTTYLQQAS